MSIIEQAARRLEELRRSGIDVARPSQVLQDAGHNHCDALPARLAQRLDRRQPVGRDANLPTSPERAPTPARPAAEIDLHRLAAMQYITPEQPRSQIANEFRVIKRQLLATPSSGDAPGSSRRNVIMVTSALPGEGKTFVSINLAMSIAMERDRRVLLVDADVSRPSVLSRLGLSQSTGLLDVLAGRAPRLADLLLRTNVERLTILPAGTPHGQATEMLASADMSQLLDELASRYPDRVLIFDAPPLLPSPESRALASHMGQVILVVQAALTKHKAVMQALTTVEACPLVLPLLNRISRSEVGSYYDYYGSVAT